MEQQCALATATLFRLGLQDLRSWDGQRSQRSDIYHLSYGKEINVVYGSTPLSMDRIEIARVKDTDQGFLSEMVTLYL